MPLVVVSVSAKPRRGRFCAVTEVLRSKCEPGLASASELRAEPRARRPIAKPRSALPSFHFLALASTRVAPTCALTTRSALITHPRSQHLVAVYSFSSLSVQKFALRHEPLQQLLRREPHARLARSSPSRSARHTDCLFAARPSRARLCTLPQCALCPAP